MDVLDLARLLGVLRRQRRVGFISEPQDRRNPRSCDWGA
jgi:hypothetical protein